MTVLLEENAVCESSSAPPRKKLCLSLTTRGKLSRVSSHVNENISNPSNCKEEYQESNISPTTDIKDTKQPCTTSEASDSSLKTGKYTTNNTNLFLHSTYTFQVLAL